MKAGVLNRRVDLQRKTVTQDAAGQPVDAWEKIGSRVPARYVPVNGDERFVSQQFLARQQVEFHVRMALAWADLSPLDRVVYPALADGVHDAPDASVFDIIEVSEIGFGEGFKIIAARRAET